MRVQHRVARIAAPIGAGDLHQLEGVADLAGRGHVRAAAQVEPVALLVDLDRWSAGMASTSSTLNISPLSREHALGLVARPDLLGEGFVARDDLAHLLLDRRKVFGRERLVAEEVVIEAVLDHRADGDLGARPERLHGLGQHMGRVVADQLQRAGIVAGDELDPGVALDRVGEIGERAVERHRDGALGERRRDRLRRRRGR